MSDVIRLLPDSVANQIAAGEVIQRPASVVKELVENAVDSGADNITVNIKDAGRTLIQVIDNGCGMSETDARICWERHATSKIQDADDLFAIKTKGFRGEALASVAAIAEVSLKTRRKEDELGTQIRISASSFISNEPVACQEGSNFMVKNLFFNVPARRKFLKSDSTELRHIINEFNHIALAHPDIEFSLLHNNSQIYSLKKTSHRQRIITIFGKHLNQSLIPVETKTSITGISGFIGKPEFAKKTYGEQYFFVNRRFIRHPYLHKAVMKPYQQILSPDALPSYFIFFEIDPDRIDINIHPTKTEIKFEDEPAIWQILHAVIRESIGRFNLSPSLDFETGNIIDIPFLRRGTEIVPPRVHVNPDFNPFDLDQPKGSQRQSYDPQENPRSKNWELMYAGTENPLVRNSPEDKKLFTNEKDNGKFLQLKGTYILTPVKSGLMIIDQKRAHERIVYEALLQLNSGQTGVSQKTLFPETLELNAADYVTFTELNEQLSRLGFDIRDAGNHSIIIYGVPGTTASTGLRQMLEKMLEDYRNMERDLKADHFENLAKSLSTAAAIPYGKILEPEEMRELVDQLFACRNPNYSPSGKPVLKILQTEDIDKIINRP
jgi:DNA mismatch repair protein MutL